RYRQISSFGRDTIRPWHTNVSGMKKLAARDFEDMLQCAIPCFEGLLDELHNRLLMDLLFELATWHALAKLRLHTDTTLTFFEQVTTSLGVLIRKFVLVTCAHFDTKELPSEEAARGRREAAIAQKTAQTTSVSPAVRQPTGPKRKVLNLATYKMHALGDYPATIRRLGTTDSYTTQTVSVQQWFFDTFNQL
ncbi:hypothetical protein HETIRDRAFT_315304, partial [Heterobasidion irregulare TC 32-1]